MQGFGIVYKDADGFLQHCVDKDGRILVCTTHEAALESLCNQVDYLNALLKGRPEYVVVPKKKFGIIPSSEIKKVGITYDVPSYEMDRIRRQLATIMIKKVRVIG